MRRLVALVAMFAATAASAQTVVVSPAPVREQRIVIVQEEPYTPHGARIVQVDPETATPSRCATGFEAQTGDRRGACFGAVRP